MEITEIGLLAVKAESTYATDPVPTSAANCLRIVADTFSYQVGSTPVPRRVLDTSLDRLPGFNTMPNVTLKFRYELSGNRTNGATDTDITSGDVAQALKIDALLQAANLLPTYTPETTNGARDGYVTYAPKVYVTQGPSVACYWWSALKLHKLIGGKVDFKIIFEAGKMAFIDFTIMGKYSAVTDATLPTDASWLGQSQKPPIFNPSVLSFDAYLTPVVSQLEIELGNVIALRPDALSSDNIAGFIITDSVPKGRINPESVALATNDFWAHWLASTVKAIQATMGSDSGNRFQANFNAEYKSVNYADANKVRIHQIEFDIVRAQLISAIGSQMALKWF